MNFRKFVCTSLFLVFSFLQGNAQTDVVSGNAKTYAGDTLKMYSIDDYITKNETLISTAIVDADGNFSFEVKVKDVVLAYIDLTVFKGLIFLQPNRKQVIVLPEKQRIAIQDQLNPYFRKTEFYVKMLNKDNDDLNYLIPAFDKLYNQSMTEVYYTRRRYTKASTDSIENYLSSQFVSSNAYFSEYKKYRFALLDYTAYHRSKDDIVKQLFTNQEILQNNPAYSELFDELFSNIFTNGKTSAISIPGLYKCIYDKSYYSLRKTLQADPKVSTERFADYLILKGLKDSYYSDSFPKDALVAVADSLATGSKSKDFKKIAALLSERFTTLLCGYSAPDINLSDIANNEYNLQKSSGKFVYLTFYNPNSYSAISDLELIKQVRKDFPAEVLDIVTIIVSQDKNDVQKFVESNKDINWKVLWYNFDTELIKNYNIKAFPTYYLINPNGILVMNPAPSPQEYFNEKFTAIFRNWKNEQYRQQYRDNKGVK